MEAQARGGVGWSGGRRCLRTAFMISRTWGALARTRGCAMAVIGMAECTAVLFVRKEATEPRQRAPLSMARRARAPA